MPNSILIEMLKIKDMQIKAYELLLATNINHITDNNLHTGQQSEKVSDVLKSIADLPSDSSGNYGARNSSIRVDESQDKELILNKINRTNIRTIGAVLSNRSRDRDRFRYRPLNRG